MSSGSSAGELEDLPPKARLELDSAIEAGRATSSAEHADLALRLCRERRRSRLRQLAVVLPTILVGSGLLLLAVISETEEDGVDSGDVVFVVVLFSIMGAGFALWWWSALVRPLQRAEIANRILIEGGVPPEPPPSRFANWAYAAFISWILTAILGAVLFRGLDLPIPEWVGFPLWALIGYGTKIALDERDGERDD